MIPAKATLTVRLMNGHASVLDITGDITAAAETALMAAYSQATTAGARSLILNFNGLEYMNSSGIGLLVTLLVRANRNKHRLLACGLSEHYRQIFELTRLNEAIGIFDSEVEALTAAGG